jgi:hypothetical protein
MTIERLRSLCDSEPLRPFIIHLADGRQLPVRHREFIASAPSGRTVTVYQPDDTMNIVDLLVVTDLEIEAGPNATRKEKQS